MFFYTFSLLSSSGSDIKNQVLFTVKSTSYSYKKTLNYQISSKMFYHRLNCHTVLHFRGEPADGSGRWWGLQTPAQRALRLQFIITKEYLHAFSILKILPFRTYSSTLPILTKEEEKLRIWERWFQDYPKPMYSKGD